MSVTGTIQTISVTGQLSENNITGQLSEINSPREILKLFWMTLISATIENENPANVILTFPTPGSLTASDFTIDGFTILSNSWNGSVLTLILNDDVTFEDGNLEIYLIDLPDEPVTIINNVEFLWSSYWKNQSLFFLDGTITDVAGTKYFVDKSANGRNFLITGYDFASDWTTGFPYKSAATISAPAGDAALIAADINNFLYDAGGTPNQIPVVSLFQDIDYEHKIFCKHAAQQVVDVTVETAIAGIYEDIEIETYEPRISHIYMATDILTGDNLIKAYVDFEVPAEDNDYKWVDPVNGNDSNAGTKAAPYKTLCKAGLVAANYYVKTGNDIGAGGYGLGYVYLDVTTSLSIKCIGRVTLTPTSTARAIYSVKGNHTIDGLIINGAGLTDDGATIYGVNDKIIKYRKCFFENFKANLTNLDSAVNLGNEFTECVFKGFDAETFANQNVKADATLYDTCYFSNVSVYQYRFDWTFKHNKFHANDKAYCILQSTGISPTIYGNKFTFSLGCLFSDIYNDNEDVKITLNHFYQGDKSGAGGTSILLQGTKSTFVVQQNYFYSSVESYTSGSVGFINARGAGNYITDNILISKCIESFPHITVNGDNGIIDNNYSNSQSLSGSQISVGNESSVAGSNDGCIIVNNRVIGYKVENPSAEGATTHGIFLNGGVNMKVAYNYVSHTTLGIVVKTGDQLAYTAEGVYYNLINDCYGGIWIRGVAGLNVLNNTIRHSNTAYDVGFAFGIRADENSAKAGDQFSENIVCKNNIVTNALGTGYAVGFDDHAAANGCDFTDGVAHGCLNVLHTDSNDYSSIALAQAAGFMADVISTDPELINMIPATPISIGEDLGTDYDDGLDVASTFGSTTTVPSITTKQQAATWQAGAYIV